MSASLSNSSPNEQLLFVTLKYNEIFMKQGEKGAQGPPGNMGPQGRPVSICLQSATGLHIT